MENVLIRIAENSPTLAVLAIVLVITFRMFSRLITSFLDTLQGLNNNFEKLIAEVKEQSNKTNHFIRIVEDAHNAELQAHQYQRMEHEQIVKVLERLNGQK